MIGFVRYFNVRKQFGFIELDDAGVPVAHFYFHRLAVVGPPVDWGDEVDFWIGDGRRGGLVAVEVRASQVSESRVVRAEVSGPPVLDRVGNKI